VRRRERELEHAVEDAIVERIAFEIEHGGFDDLGASPDRPSWHMLGGSVWLDVWNNVAHRKHEDVLAMLDAAIARQRARVAEGELSRG
jgi:hypothetical protein